jgi:hypothetical protein
LSHPLPPPEAERQEEEAAPEANPEPEPEPEPEEEIAEEPEPEAQPEPEPEYQPQPEPAPPIEEDEEQMPMAQQQLPQAAAPQPTTTEEVEVAQEEVVFDGLADPEINLGKLHMFVGEQLRKVININLGQDWRKVRGRIDYGNTKVVSVGGCTVEDGRVTLEIVFWPTRSGFEDFTVEVKGGEKTQVVHVTGRLHAEAKAADKVVIEGRVGRTTTKILPFRKALIAHVQFTAKVIPPNKAVRISPKSGAVAVGSTEYPIKVHYTPMNTKPVECKIIITLDNDEEDVFELDCHIREGRRKRSG